MVSSALLQQVLIVSAQGAEPLLLSVRDFGAVGDGLADDGPALQAAFDAAAAAAAAAAAVRPGNDSGVEVLLPGPPPGMPSSRAAYRSARPLYFRASNARLHIAAGATLRFGFDTDLKPGN